MKKYTLLSILLLSLASLVNSQSLVIRNSNGDVISGTTINIDVHPSEELVSKSFQVTNESNNTLQVNARRYENECTEGSGEYFCWTLCLMPAECGTYPVNENPYAQQVNANSISDVSLLTDFKPSLSSDEDGLEGTSSYTYVVFDENNQNDTAFITLVYNVDYTVGVNELTENTISNIYPNPAKNKIQFNLNTNLKQAEFEIYSLVGRMVKSVKIENAEGKISINIDELVSGIYFLTEKNSSVTRKFIVSK